MIDFNLVSVRCNEALREILMAELAEIGFESFEELDNGFQGAIAAETYNQKKLSEIFDRYTDRNNISWEATPVEKQNWNKIWEENYSPVVVDNKIRVRASFHTLQPEYDYEIIINPKMSFGTGHHETTWLMLRSMLNVSMTGNSVLDAGCGTGILCIMAGKLGAKEITGFDHEEWAVENAKENLRINNISARIVFGSIDLIKEKQFDVILANINKNVLMEQMPEYAKKLSPSGKLLISGFYDNDTPDLTERANSTGLKKLSGAAKNNWALLLLTH